MYLPSDKEIKHSRAHNKKAFFSRGMIADNEIITIRYYFN
jgi:hypothetical protein